MTRISLKLLKTMPIEVLPDTVSLRDVLHNQPWARVAASSGDDVIFGTKSADFLFGQGGNDTIFGEGGNDRIFGGADTDLMIGGFGNDVYFRDTDDSIIEQAGQGIDTVFTATSLDASGTMENVEIIRGITGSSGLSLRGNAVSNLIVGTSLGDTIYGNGGDDTMIGGGGNDEYILYNNSAVNGDVIVEGVCGGIDTVLLSTVEDVPFSYVMEANIENLRPTVFCFDDFTVTGNGLSNDIRLSAGDDVILGGDGNDTIDGGGGNDVLSGNAGSDVFVFNSTQQFFPTDVTVITDFSHADDTIALFSDGFAGVAAGTLDAAAFKAIGSGGAVDADDRILYDPTTGEVFFDSDGSGAEAAQLLLILAGNPVIDCTDFFGFSGTFV